MQAYFAALLQVTVENGTDLQCKLLHEEKGRSTSSNFGVVCQYGILVDLECCYLGARPGCLVREESALVDVKFVSSVKPLSLMETARQKNN
ncbi:hypothetical protein PR048_012216 [Dryococelus australis]|uniref:Uncharacterized protein n=1 Tax=Dryococelus australis TaxID=614101 RepID=A0ABQ9HNZ8_9NEOP|nr:hypothetical protein PR048_012216 [Dryococelus australis]